MCAWQCVFGASLKSLSHRRWRFTGFPDRTPVISTDGSAGCHPVLSLSLDHTCIDIYKHTYRFSVISTSSPPNKPTSWTWKRTLSLSCLLQLTHTTFKEFKEPPLPTSSILCRNPPNNVHRHQCTFTPRAKPCLGRKHPALWISLQVN